MFRDKNYGKITENFEPDFERNFRKIPEFRGADRVLQKKTYIVSPSLRGELESV